MQTVRLEHSRQITPDVLVGLRLYGRLTGELTPDSEDRSIAKWRYWFDANPFAEGFFAVAKCDDRVVGMRSIIPVAMRVGGRRILGGKGEFFVVDPDFRRAVVQDTKQSVPIALQMGLRDWAYEHGLEAHFGVGTPTAASLALLTGGKRLEFPCTYLTLPFERPSKPRGSRKQHNLVKLWLRRLLAPCLRMWARWRCPRCPRASLQELTTFDSLGADNGSGLNQFVATDSGSLDFRFPSDRHIRFAIKLADDASPKVFVFAKPASRADVHMLYWSRDLSDASDLIALAAVEMIRRCAMARSSKLTFVLPEGDQAACASLHRLGFFSRRRTESVVLHLPNADELSKTSPQDWMFNLAHQRFYQEG